MADLDRESYPEDPATWSIENVIQHFCYEPNPLWATCHPQIVIPEKVHLEQKFRDNDINGECLLELDNSILKDDLEIKSFGHRRAICSAIEFLRSKSQTYRHHHVKKESESQTPETEAKTTHTQSCPPQAEHRLRNLPRSSEPASTALLANVGTIFPPDTSYNLSSFGSLGQTSSSQYSQPHSFDLSSLPSLDQLNVHNSVEETASELIKDVNQTFSSEPENSAHLSDHQRSVNNSQLENQHNLSLLPISHQTGDGTAPTSVKPKRRVTTTLISDSTTSGTSLHEFETQTIDSRGSTAGTSVHPHSGTQDLDELDEDHRYLLEKWHGGEELPLYGASGSENEYDEETWNEIEEEREEKQAETNFLSNEEVNQAIDETLADLRTLWRETRLEKFKFKAYDLWMKAAHKKCNRKVEIQKAVAKKTRALQNIQNLREMALGNDWRRISEVKALHYGCLEANLFHHEEADYYLQVLDKEDPPELPDREVLRQQKRKPVEIIPGEDALDSEDEKSDNEFVIYSPSIASTIEFDDPEDDWKPNLPLKNAQQAGEVRPKTPDSNIGAQIAADFQTYINGAADHDESDSEVISSWDKKQRRIGRLPPSKISLPREDDYDISDESVQKISPFTFYADKGTTGVDAIDLTLTSPLAKRSESDGTASEQANINNNSTFKPKAIRFVDSSKLNVSNLEAEKEAQDLQDVVMEDISESVASSPVQPRPVRRSKARDRKRKILDADETDSDEELVNLLSSSRKAETKRRKVDANSNFDAQKYAHERVEEEQRCRAIQEKKLKDIQDGDETEVVVNAQEPYVYLDKHIASRVRPHQIRGIRFMWREVITDKHHNGCLLAHTMGLGKTVQVIALLVTIAQCNQSSDPEVRQQIPEHLRVNRSIVLCPASLIDNWYDEVHMWLPRQDSLGAIYKISSIQDYPQIRNWSRIGGLLMITYSRFALLAGPKAQIKDEAAQANLNPSEVPYGSILLDEPNLVIADEAHQLKNSKAQLTMITQKFKTTSRIAMTGSPLNNYLDEYYVMIDWISPGYLGTLPNFKSKYTKPIMEGSYKESSPEERRLCLKRLAVLKRDIDPKIDRADLASVAIDMPPKTEFYITIPLTNQQKEAYNIYVAFLLDKHRTSGVNDMIHLWHWLAALSLLCNHPTCFVKKIRERASNSKVPKKTQGSGTQVDKNPAKLAVEAEDETLDGIPEDVSVDHIKPSVEIMEKITQAFEKEIQLGILDDIHMSYRTAIVKQIVEKAVSLGDKTLIFSHSIPTLDFLQKMMKDMGCKYCRLDGSTQVQTRQATTKSFNQGTNGCHVFLISMRAGGLGLNLQGANRVIIFDFGFNPTWEEQAVARAHRMGQQKPVFVYRFRTGGTYEETIYNKALFKTQLFQRIIDKKNPLRHASRKFTDYLFPAKEVVRQDFSSSLGKDPGVLDLISSDADSIKNIELTETFQKEDDEELSPEEQKAVDEEYADFRLLRDNPAEYDRQQAAKRWAASKQARKSQPAPNTPVTIRSARIQPVPILPALSPTALRGFHINNPYAASQHFLPMPGYPSNATANDSLVLNGNITIGYPNIPYGGLSATTATSMPFGNGAGLPGSGSGPATGIFTIDRTRDDMTSDRIDQLADTRPRSMALPPQLALGTEENFDSGAVVPSQAQDQALDNSIGSAGVQAKGQDTEEGKGHIR